ncbi:MAG: winged-helix domain-containing protein [Tepidibacillus sp.]
MVVNDIWENTIETTKLLRETGIELNFIPYVPGESVQSQVNIAVTPNEERFVPEQIEKVINIGDRILDLSIYYELIQFYQLEEVYYNLITNRYMKSILKLAKELDHEVSEIVKMNHQDQQLSKVESKQIEKAKMHLEKYGMLYDGILILNEYLEGKKQGKSFGRNSLRKTLQKKGYDFSEQQLRTRISLLGKYGLLIIRSGRLGTTISPLGENFLEKLTRKRKIKN